jgi:hypothetical protein
MQVSFTRIPYAEVVKRHKRQDAIWKRVNGAIVPIGQIALLLVIGWGISSMNPSAIQYSLRR